MSGKAEWYASNATITNEELQSLKRKASKLTTTEAKLKLAIEVLRFYADIESWNIVEHNGWAGFIKSDDIDSLGFGGERAREALRQINDVDKPE